jgi:hypothetical protein
MSYSPIGISMAFNERGLSGFHSRAAFAREWAEGPCAYFHWDYQ